MSEGLAKGSFVAARVEWDLTGVGFEPVTLRMQGTELTTELLIILTTAVLYSAPSR